MMATVMVKNDWAVKNGDADGLDGEGWTATDGRSRFYVHRPQRGTLCEPKTPPPCTTLVLWKSTTGPIVAAPRRKGAQLRNRPTPTQALLRTKGAIAQPGRISRNTL